MFGFFQNGYYKADPKLGKDFLKSVFPISEKDGSWLFHHPTFSIKTRRGAGIVSRFSRFIKNINRDGKLHQNYQFDPGPFGN